MKRIILCAPLLILGVLLASCSEDPSGPAGIVGPAMPDARTGSGFNLDHLEYETISGTLQPNQSGIMYEYLTTWPRNCLFGLIVPESSMPGSTPIDFTMRIPTQASYLNPEFAEYLKDKLIIRLGPDGEQFSGPITVMGTWMPWAGAPPDPLYFWNGSDWGEATVTLIGNRYRVTFQVDHFSDWEVGPVLPPEPPEE